MKEFIFCNKTDNSQEPIAKCIANSLEEAIECFAERKNLKIQEFLNIYDVLEA